VSTGLTSETSVPNLFYAVFSSLNGPQKKVDSAAVLKGLVAALKKDDSLANLGFAFQVSREGYFAFMYEQYYRKFLF